MSDNIKPVKTTEEKMYEMIKEHLGIEEERMINEAEKEYFSPEAERKREEEYNRHIESALADEEIKREIMENQAYAGYEAMEDEEVRAMREEDEESAKASEEVEQEDY